MNTKPYRVSRITGSPNFDSLPVAKITDYPLEQRDYKPFAQSILCVSEHELFLRMWAFEVSPGEHSALACVLYPYPDKPSQAVLLRIVHEVDCARCGVSLLQDGQPAPGAPPAQGARPQNHPHNGEDLQGVYWGMTLSLPLSDLREMGGGCSLAPGDVVPGNFYKTCPAGQFAHMGSLFRAAFPDNPYGRESMGDFCVVGY